MKTFLRTGLLALFLLGAYAPVSAHAQAADVDDPMLVYSQADGMNLVIQLANLEQETTYVNLTTIDGEDVFYTERISNHNGFSMALQLQELPEGKYLLTVKKGDVVKNQVVVIEFGDVLLSSIS